METKSFFKRNEAILATFTGIAICVGVGVGVFRLAGSDAEQDIGYAPYQSQSCNVAGVGLRGALMTYLAETTNEEDEDVTEAYDATSSENIGYLIDEAKNLNHIKAILVEVDSYGGSPVAGEEVASFITRAGKPVVAVIRQAGTSAAYWAISPADRIFASRNSDIGGIGVTMSYLQEASKDKKFIELASGKFKDTGNSDKPITDEERTLLLRDLKIAHQNFIEDVAQNRKLSIDAVSRLADGSTMLGAAAKEAGLIDEIGSNYEAEAYLSQQLGEKARVCW